MSNEPQPPRWTPEDYLQAAREYHHSVSSIYFRKATTQAKQRDIISFALDQILHYRPDLEYIIEMLTQQLVEGRLVQVMVTTAVVLGELPSRWRDTYQPHEELPLFWALDYIFPGDPDGRFVRNRYIFEHELRVPYYLTHEMIGMSAVLHLYRHDGTAYQPVPPNKHGRYAVPELDIEVGLIDGWARLWFKGKLQQTLSDREKDWDRIQAERLFYEEVSKLQTRWLAECDEVQKKGAEIDRQKNELLALSEILHQIHESKARYLGLQAFLQTLPASPSHETLLRWLREAA
jgi:hypothetical protein